MTTLDGQRAYEEERPARARRPLSPESPETPRRAERVPLRKASADRWGTAPVRRFRPDIEGLRAVAVTLVVLSHVGLGFPGGYVGVDVFFVISGFLITRQLVGDLERDQKINFGRFYARRARRILPAAAVTIVATVLAVRAWDSPLRIRQDALDAFYSAFSGVNWRLASHQTDYFNATAAPSPFQHFWSLAVEEQFYVVWPALLLVVGGTLGRRWGHRRALVWVLLAIMACSLAFSGLTTVSSPSWAYFGTHTRAWELALGALLAVTIELWTKMPPALASQMSWLGLGLILIASLTYDEGTAFPGWAVILPVVGSAFVIAGGCPGWSRGGELLLRLRPFQFVGGISYSWYLAHWAILTILPLALGRGLSLGDRWLVAASSFAAATVMFYLVEHPIRSAPQLVGLPRYGLAFGLALAVVSSGTAIAVSQQARIPQTRDTLAAPVRLAPTSDVGQIEKAVAAATGLKTLPADLNPSLEKAPRDYPDCLAEHTVTRSPSEGECTMGDPRGARTAILLGDSHANTWTPAIDAFAKLEHLRLLVFGKPACPPGEYTNQIDPETNRLYTACDEWRANTLAQIQALKPAVVVVTSELRTLEIDPAGNTQSFRSLRASGARVVLLEDTPNPQRVGPVPDCLARHPADISRCALARMDPQTRLDGMIQRKVVEGAARTVGIATVDATSFFCTATTCPPVINGIVVYSDASHVTATYVTWIAPAVADALAKAVS